LGVELEARRVEYPTVTLRQSTGSA